MAYGWEELFGSAGIDPVAYRDDSIRIVIDSHISFGRPVYQKVEFILHCVFPHFSPTVHSVPSVGGGNFSGVLQDALKQRLNII